MAKRRILVQLDSDPHASVFDAVVAVDAGVDQLLQYHGVRPEQVRDLVFGAMFTRGPEDLHNTAIFVGGSNVAAGEALLEQVTKCFFGPMRVSVLLDANGANTTASAAVLSVAQQTTLAGAEALVLAGTGPVGKRVARLLARQGARVRVGSRDADRAAEVCQQLASSVTDGQFTAAGTSSPEQLEKSLDGVSIVVAAGAAGVCLLPEALWSKRSDLKVVVDLNAVPPLGIEGVKTNDRAEQRHGVSCFGAIGVGGLKMKIHRAALQQLFTRNDLVLDAEEVFAIGQTLS